MCIFFQNDIWVKFSKQIHLIGAGWCVHVCVCVCLWGGLMSSEGRGHSGQHTQVSTLFIRLALLFLTHRCTHKYTHTCVHIDTHTYKRAALGAGGPFDLSPRKSSHLHTDASFSAKGYTHTQRLDHIQPSLSFFIAHLSSCTLFSVLLSFAVIWVKKTLKPCKASESVWILLYFCLHSFLEAF